MAPSLMHDDHYGTARRPGPALLNREQVRRMQVKTTRFRNVGGGRRSGSEAPDGLRGPQDFGADIIPRTGELREEGGSPSRFGVMGRPNLICTTGCGLIKKEISQGQ